MSITDLVVQQAQLIAQLQKELEEAQQELLQLRKTNAEQSRMLREAAQPKEPIEVCTLVQNLSEHHAKCDEAYAMCINEGWAKTDESIQSVWNPEKKAIQHTRILTFQRTAPKETQHPSSEPFQRKYPLASELMAKGAAQVQERMNQEVITAARQHLQSNGTASPRPELVTLIAQETES